MVKLQAIDDSNREAHFYLTPDDECYYLHEFTARQGYAYSPGNQFIFNLKKSPKKRQEPQYQHKLRAIESAIRWYRTIFDGVKGVYSNCTFVPIPPSKLPGHEDYDDRMWHVVEGVCRGKNADARKLILQIDSYDSAHLIGDGSSRIKPTELQALYRLDPSPPKPNVLLFDDVLSAGCHFRAAKATIIDRYPDVRVIGFFLARRVLPNPLDDFESV